MLQIQYLTDNRLSSVSSSQDKVAKVIKNLDPNLTPNAHGKKVCGPSIYKPLEIIFNQCIETGVFPSDWKKSNIVSIHDKGDKWILKKVPPVLLLTICGKILEKLILMKCSHFLLKISSGQSGFKSGDSCIKQLLSITHEIYSFFDEGLEVRSIFVDISKAFDKVWQHEIIFELTQNGISGSLLNLLHDFDLTESLSVNAKLFADDTSLFSVIHDIQNLNFNL